MNQALPRNGNCYATVVMVDISPVDMQFLLGTPRGDDFSGNPTSLIEVGFFYGGVGGVRPLCL